MTTTEHEIRNAATVSNFMEAWDTMAEIAQTISAEHGFWEGGKERNQAEMIALMHSELSECLEGIREGNPPDKHIQEFSSVAVELADTVIRIMDFAHGLNHDVAAALIQKMVFNNSRPPKHGKQF